VARNLKMLLRWGECAVKMQRRWGPTMINLEDCVVPRLLFSGFNEALQCQGGQTTLKKIRIDKSLVLRRLMALIWGAKSRKNKSFEQTHIPSVGAPGGKKTIKTKALQPSVLPYLLPLDGQRLSVHNQNKQKP